MTYVLTIIGTPSSATLSEETVEVIKKTIGDVTHHTWLADGRACDIFFNTDTPLLTPEERQKQAQHALSEIDNSAQFDLCVQPAQDRRKKLLIADMDSTIIRQECIDEIGNILGLKEKIAAITERAMRGELEFESALTERVGLLRGISRDQLQHVLDSAIELTPGARTLVQTMNQNGAVTALISGGFTFFTQTIAEKLGFQHNQANELLFEGDLLNGEVARPILGMAAKKDALISLRQQNGLTRDLTLAVGDGANDLAMIEEAGLGVAFHAKPAVAQAANACVHANDLTALLFFQGYSQEEFIS